MDLAAKADSDASADESDGGSESGSDDSFVVPDGNAEQGFPMPFDQAAAAQERDEMHAAARRFEAEDSGPSGIEMHESGTDLGSEAGEGGDGSDDSIDASEEDEEGEDSEEDSEEEDSEEEEANTLSGSLPAPTSILPAAQAATDSSQEVEVLHTDEAGESLWFFALLDGRADGTVHGRWLEDNEAFEKPEHLCRRRSRLAGGMFVEVNKSVVKAKGGGWRRDGWSWCAATLRHLADDACEVDLHQWSGKTSRRIYPISAVRPSHMCEALIDGAWYYGRITNVHTDDLSVDIKFERRRGQQDSEIYERHPAAHVRPMTPLKAGSAVDMPGSDGSAVDIDWDEEWWSGGRVCEVLARKEGITYTVQVPQVMKGGRIQTWEEIGAELGCLRPSNHHVSFFDHRSRLCFCSPLCRSLHNLTPNLCLSAGHPSQRRRHACSYRRGTANGGRARTSQRQ